MAKPGLTLAASALRQVLKYSAQPGAMDSVETLASTRRERKISSRAVLVRHSQDTVTGAAGAASEGERMVGIDMDEGGAAGGSPRQ